jgi:hypothetical protein
MADAAYHTLVYYRGTRFEEAQHDSPYHCPHYVPEEEVWTIEVPDTTISKLQAQVLLTSELIYKVSGFEDELRHER